MVTGRKVISFVSIFGSHFLSHQKISVTSKDTAELNVKHVKPNVITTKSIKMAHENLARAGSCSNRRYHGYYATFYVLPNLHVGGRTIYKHNNSLNYKKDIKRDDIYIYICYHFTDTRASTLTRRSA